MKAFPTVFFVMTAVGRGDGEDVVMLCRKNGNRKVLGNKV